MEWVAEEELLKENMMPYNQINEVVKPGMLQANGRPPYTPNTPLNPALRGMGNSNFNPIGRGPRPIQPIAQGGGGVFQPNQFGQLNQPLLPPTSMGVPPVIGGMNQPPVNPLLQRAAQGTLQRYGMGNYF